MSKRFQMAARDFGSHGISGVMEQIDRYKVECTRRWAPILEGIEDDTTRKNVALLLENQRRFYEAQRQNNSFMEDLTTGDISIYDKFAFPIIRALFPQLAATDLVSVQPMSGPTSMVFFLNYVYGTTKGGTTAGTALFENPDAAYSSETIDGEGFGGATVTANTQITATLSFTPIQPGTVILTATTAGGSVTVTDDGAGALVGDVGSGGAMTIDYATGAIDFSFDTNTTAQAVATYDYNLELQSDIPQVDLILSQAPVVAKERKLRTRWSFEAAQDLKAVHGLDAEAELTAETTTELRFEIDLQIINALWSVAIDGVGGGHVPIWSKNPPVGVSFQDHKQTLIDLLVAGSAAVNRITGRANPNWIVAGYNVTNILETLPNFQADPAASFMGRGIRRIGSVGRWDVYLNPAMDQLSGGSQSHYLIGFKGDSFLHSGYVYAPYVPLFTTPTVSLDDFMIRKGFASRYATRVINSDFYLKGYITI